MKALVVIRRGFHSNNVNRILYGGQFISSDYRKHV